MALAQPLSLLVASAITQGMAATFSSANQGLRTGVSMCVKSCVLFERIAQCGSGGWGRGPRPGALLESSVSAHLRGVGGRKCLGSDPSSAASCRGACSGSLTHSASSPHSCSTETVPVAQVEFCDEPQGARVAKLTQQCCVLAQVGESRLKRGVKFMTLCVHVCK